MPDKVVGEYWKVWEYSCLDSTKALSKMTWSQFECNSVERNYSFNNMTVVV